MLRSRESVAVAIGVVTLGVALAPPGRADHQGYSEVAEVKAERPSVSCLHRHDWTEKTRLARYEMIRGATDVFGPENDYSWLECRDKRQGKVLFRRSMVPLTYLWISEDERFVVGLSYLKSWNPYHVVLVDMQGALMFKLHVTDMEACLTKSELSRIVCAYPRARELLLEHTVQRGPSLFLDYSFATSLDRIGEALWYRLYPFRCRSHLTPNIRESVSNWVHWYDEERPALVLEYDAAGQPAALNLSDLALGPVRIPFHEPVPELGPCRAKPRRRSDAGR